MPSRRRIEGVAHGARPSTEIGKIVWNVFNSVSLLALFGGPYFGSSEATVELRIYHDGELVGTRTATGRGNWRVSSFQVHFRIWEPLRRARTRSKSVAYRVALERALAGLAEPAPPGTAQ